MDSMRKNKPRPRRSFTPEFQAEIVEQCRRGDHSLGQIAKDFDPTETAARDWMKQAETDAGERSLLTRAAVTPFEQFTSRHSRTAPLGTSKRPRAHRRNDYERPSAEKSWITFPTRTALVNDTSAISATGMPCTGNSTRRLPDSRGDCRPGHPAPAPDA
ncbi:transposase [Streptomyces sp. NPDC050287]|uniref:transposase n=1 Tax=Streptomyces sp. NPDC050287 TaxID=3365608 RepID=UPI00379A3C29